MSYEIEKLLILGLDSLNWKVLQPLLDAGAMPRLKALQTSGSHGILRSTLPPTTPPAWATFMTGVEPGVHGIIGFKSFNPTSNTYDLLKTKNLGPRSFYAVLSDAGKRVGVGMQPSAHPPFELNGFVITGFDSPGTQTDFATPKSLEKEIMDWCPDHERNYELKKDWEEEDGQNDEAFERNVDRLIESVRRQTGLYLKLIEHQRPDVLMAYFQAPDVLFHHAWGWCDPETSDAVANPKRRKKVEAFFGELDQACGRLMDAFPSEKRLTLALSDHGHQARAINANMNSILQELGFLQPAGTLDRLRDTLTGAKKKSQDRGLGVAVDWSKTLAFMPMGEQSAFIYINLKDRQPYGCVALQDYANVRDQIIEKLKAYRRPDTGERAFTEIYSGDDVFERKDEFLLPDIVVNPPANVQFKRKIRSGPTFHDRKDPHTGNHHPDGFYLWHGPGVSNAQNNSSDPADLADVAPTILAVMSVPIPSYMKGKPQQSSFKSGLDPQYVPKEWKEGEGGQNGQDQAAYSAEEEALVEQRLEDLGYVD